MAREALSARIDDEPEPVPQARVDEHLRSCRRCTDWYASAREQAVVLRRLAGVQRDPRLGGDGADTGARGGGPVAVCLNRCRRYGLRGALAVAGLIQIGLAAAQATGMHFGMVAAHHGHATGAHLLNETTAWGAALGIVTTAAALRPGIAAGLGGVLVAYVGLLGCYVIADALTGQVTAARIVSHGPVAAAPVLSVLVWNTERRSPPPSQEHDTADKAPGPPHLRPLRRDRPTPASNDSAA